MASNSVSSGVWSLPPQEGIKAWWKLDESSGNFALDEIGGNNGTLVAMDSSDYVFGRIGNLQSHYHWNLFALFFLTMVCE